MRAAVYYGNNKVEIEDVPEPTVSAAAHAGRAMTTCATPSAFTA